MKKKSALKVPSQIEAHIFIVPNYRQDIPVSIVVRLYPAGLGKRRTHLQRLGEVWFTPEGRPFRWSFDSSSERCNFETFSAAIAYAESLAENPEDLLKDATELMVRV